MIFGVTDLSNFRDKCFEEVKINTLRRLVVIKEFLNCETFLSKVKVDTISTDYALPIIKDDIDLITDAEKLLSNPNFKNDTKNLHQQL
jgi:hypothetical protein